MTDHRTATVRRAGRARAMVVGGSAAASIAIASTLAMSAHAGDQTGTTVTGSGTSSASSTGASTGLVGEGQSTTSHAKSSGS